jgi:hypothetical protein
MGRLKSTLTNLNRNIKFLQRFGQGQLISKDIKYDC